jgi:antitoxin MazE
MSVLTSQWGNSIAIRIPRQTAQKAGLAVGTPVDMEVIDGNLVISLAKKTYQLDELLVGVTPEVVGGEYDWGEPVGKEVW